MTELPSLVYCGIVFRDGTLWLSNNAVFWMTIITCLFASLTVVFLFLRRLMWSKVNADLAEYREQVSSWRTQSCIWKSSMEGWKARADKLQKELDDYLKRDVMAGVDPNDADEDERPLPKDDQ